MLKCFSGSSDCSKEIWMTGIFACGYIIIKGTKTPWSYPLYSLNFLTLIPLLAIESITACLCYAELLAGYL